MIKKMIVLVFIGLVVAVPPGTFAQVSMSDISLLNPSRYISIFGFKNGAVDSNDQNYIWKAPRADRVLFRDLGGESAIDTPLEFALLSYYSQPVIKIRPVEADTILPANDPKLADKKLGAAVIQDLQILRFLGNTAAVGRYEGMLKFITDRGNVTRAEIETFYHDGIRKLVSDIVDEEFKKERNGWVPYNVYVNSGNREVIDGIKDIITSFFLNPNADTYAAVLTVSKHFLGQYSSGFAFAGHVDRAYTAVIAELSSALWGKVDSDLSNKIPLPASVQNNEAVKKVTKPIPREALLSNAGR